MTLAEALSELVNNPMTVLYNGTQSYRFHPDFRRFETTRIGRSSWIAAITFPSGEFSREPVTTLTKENLLEVINVLSEKLKAEDLTDPLVSEAVSKARAAASNQRG